MGRIHRRLTTREVLALARQHQHGPGDRAVRRAMIPNASGGGGGFGSAGSNYAPARVSGSEFYPTWGHGVTARSLTGGDIGLCVISPIFLETDRTYDRLRVRVNNASNSVHRVGIYYMNTTTWLPSSLALDAGTVTWVGVGADMTIAISFTPTQAACGLAMLFESRTDAVNPSIPTLSPFTGGPWPPGYDDASANLNDVDHHSIQSTGNSPGAMPAAGTFTLVVQPTQASVQYLIGIRAA